jgi:hypothetical protein
MPWPPTLAAPQGMEEVKYVTVTIPLVLIVGVIVYAAWRFMGLRAWQAIVCLLFGFLLATTSVAPSIQRIVTVIIHSLSGLW